MTLKKRIKETFPNNKDNFFLQRVAEITSKLQNSLEHELVLGLDEGNTKQVHRCLNSYALISKAHDAETLVRIHVVEPFMKQVR